MKNYKAITLISLVITIVVLIILASVGIYLSLESNGIFTRAKQAKKLYENAQEKENQELNELYGQLLVASDGTINNISVEKLKEIISSTGNPTGTIISYMGNNAPNGYLSCDGKKYNISDYKDLAEQIKNEFGSYNYYGGDGTNTFAVPDLRGEFLRGTGNNSRTNQGNGATVGSHQDATEHLFFGYNGSNDLYVQNSLSSGNNISALYCDRLKVDQSSTGLFWRATGTFTDFKRTYYTSRPTNTSVLYCIKY